MAFSSADTVVIIMILAFLSVDSVVFARIPVVFIAILTFLSADAVFVFE